MEARVRILGRREVGEQRRHGIASETIAGPNRSVARGRDRQTLRGIIPVTLLPERCDRTPHERVGRSTGCLCRDTADQQSPGPKGLEIKSQRSEVILVLGDARGIRGREIHGYGHGQKLLRHAASTPRVDQTLV